MVTARVIEIQRLSAHRSDIPLPRPAAPPSQRREVPVVRLGGDDDPLVPVVNGHILARLAPEPIGALGSDR